MAVEHETKPNCQKLQQIQSELYEVWRNDPMYGIQINEHFHKDPTWSRERRTHLNWKRKLIIITFRVPPNAQGPDTANVNDYMVEKTGQIWHILLQKKMKLGNIAKQLQMSNCTWKNEKGQTTTKKAFGGKHANDKNMFKIRS